MPTPSKFNAETQDLICRLVRAGVSAREAALAAGISERTIYVWQVRHRGFRDAVAHARAESEASLVARVSKASTTSWQAAAWQLERSYPERWAAVSERERVGDQLDAELDRILGAP